MKYRISKCPCGHRSCKRWELDGPSVMMHQGSGFDGEELAQKVCDFLNKEVENDAAVQIAEEAFRAGWKAREEHWSSDAMVSSAEDRVRYLEEAWSAYEPSEAAKDLTR